MTPCAGAKLELSIARVRCSTSDCTVARRASSSSEICRGSGCRSGRSSGRQISSTRIGALNASGRTCGRVRKRRNWFSTSIQASTKRALTKWVVRLEELHEVLNDPIAQARVARIVLGRIGFDLLLAFWAENFDHVFLAVGDEGVDAVGHHFEMILESEQSGPEAERLIFARPRGGNERAAGRGRRSGRGRRVRGSGELR